MNRSRVIRRALALAAGTALVSTVTLAMAASPASAHRTFLEGTCATGNDGGWTVTWTVRNNETTMPATITKVVSTPTGTTVTGIEVGSVLPAGGTLTAVQSVPAGKPWAALEVAADWGDNGQWNNKPNRKSVPFDAVKCAAPTPTPSASSPAPETPVPTPSASVTPPASSPSPSASVAPPAPSASATPGPGLPVTGSAIGGISVAAAVLLAIGVAMFVIARRRRIRFTA